MLGHALIERLAPIHDVVSVDVEEMDVRSWTVVWSRVEEVRPEVVIHGAAFTRVDDCETEWDEAFAVNAVGARNVALACRRIGAPMLYVSTDYVFDGAKGEAYDESDEPRPLSVYGWSKLMGEEWVRRHHPDHWVVRAAWSYGPGGANFVRTIVERGRSGIPLEIVDDQVGSPTYTVDLADALSGLIESDGFGLYHLTNGGQASWYDLAVEALRVAGVEANVERIATVSTARAARRPEYSVLKNARWEQEGRAPLRPWREAVSEYVRNHLR